MQRRPIYGVFTTDTFGSKFIIGPFAGELLQNRVDLAHLQRYVDQMNKVTPRFLLFIMLQALIATLVLMVGYVIIIPFFTTTLPDHLKTSFQILYLANTIWIVFFFGDKFLSSITRYHLGVIARMNKEVMHPAGFHVEIMSEIVNVYPWSTEEDTILHKMIMSPFLSFGFKVEDFTVANLTSEIQTLDIQRVFSNVNSLFPTLSIIFVVVNIGAFLFSLSFWIVFFWNEDIPILLGVILFFGYVFGLVFFMFYLGNLYLKKIEPKLRRVLLDANISVFNRHGLQLSLPNDFLLQPFQLDVKNYTEREDVEENQTGENVGHMPLLVRHNQ
eukprot:TRINITY_DN4703_c0_g1_i4.p1 TRINITY_DN4703_c0_g1~~TRINITY_DN4703_c0_g1_i4.p1  ORF type:complete len:329 (-),score=30.04 TRINITY_DN4703_c0_g1_i4:119-1105(-)